MPSADELIKYFHKFPGDLDLSWQAVRNLMLAAFEKQLAKRAEEIKFSRQKITELQQEIGRAKHTDNGYATIAEQRDEALSKLAAVGKRLGEIAALPDRWRKDQESAKSIMTVNGCAYELEKALKPAPSAEEVERERFEKSCAQYGLSFTRDEGGNYRDSRTLVLFDVWQAARAAKEGEK
jgi:hypothetical protein